MATNYLPYPGRPYTAVPLWHRPCVVTVTLPKVQWDTGSPASSTSISRAGSWPRNAAGLALAAWIADEAGHAPRHVNLGGGFGIPYFHGDAPLDIAAVGAALRERLTNLPGELRETELAIELGRYLVGEAGVYLTGIVDRKVSHGRTYLVTDGGLHHQLAASGNFGAVVRRNYPLAIATRFTEEPVEQASVVGCLCTPLDMLADEAMLPRAEVGDLVAVFCAGAYGLSASPRGFLSQPEAREVLV